MQLKRIVIFPFILLLLILVFLDFNGFIWHNDLFVSQYNVKGLDVSNHQGTIDWKKVPHTYKFIYIKATEGNDFTDDYFAQNWKEAKEQGFLVGAYHFFSVRSTGKQQAASFISIVPKDLNSLPPVVDIEIDLKRNPQQIRKELQDFCSILQEYYQKKPILYVTYETYNAYIDGYFNDYQIWIRDVLKFPSLKDRQWLLWQYNNRGRIQGINSFVDINVLNGNLEDLINTTKK